MLCSLEETILFTFHHSIIFPDYIVYVSLIKRPISDVEDVVETLITYVKKSVLLVDSVNPKNSEDTVGKTKNQLLDKD